MSSQVGRDALLGQLRKLPRRAARSWFHPFGCCRGIGYPPLETGPNNRRARPTRFAFNSAFLEGFLLSYREDPPASTAGGRDAAEHWSTPPQSNVYIGDISKSLIH
jgi:hypothetical protein